MTSMNGATPARFFKTPRACRPRDVRDGGVMRAAVLLVLAATLTGCIAANSKKESRKPTIGEQIDSLHASWKKGTVMKEEYEKAKKRLLEGR